MIKTLKNKGYFVGKNKDLAFRVHNDLIKLQFSFLNAVEFNYFICILYHLRNKGDGVVFLERHVLNKTIDKKYLNYRYNACMKSMRDKLENHGFIGKSNDALFSDFDLVVVNGRVKGFEIGINKDKLYLLNNVKTCYFAIDLGVFQNLSTFTAKSLYFWHCRNKSKDSFFIASSLLKGCVGINFNSTSGDVIKIKNAIKSLCSVGIVLKVEKNKCNASKSSLYNIRFYNTTKFNQFVINPPMLNKENMAVTNPTYKPTPFKEDDAIIRFKNSVKTLIKDKANPTITPTIKNANNKPIQANNETLNKFENIVLTSPKYFDYVIKSVTKGSLYYEIKAYCDLKKKHELVKLLVAEYSNPLDYFYKQGYKFKRYDKQESDAEFEKHIHKIVSLIHRDERHGDITSYLKIMRIFKRYDDKIQVELKDVDKEGVFIKPFIAENENHLNAWFNKYQFGSY